MSVADYAIPVLQLDDLIKHQAQKKKTGQKKTEQKAGVRKFKALAQASMAWLPCYLPLPSELYCSWRCRVCTAGSAVESAVSVVRQHATAVQCICAFIVC